MSCHGSAISMLFKNVFNVIYPSHSWFSLGFIP
jgi:hypothetical protein